MKYTKRILGVSECSQKLQDIIPTLLHTARSEGHDIIYGGEVEWHDDTRLYLCTITDDDFCVSESFFIAHIACFYFCLNCCCSMRYLTDDIVEIRIHFTSDRIHTRYTKLSDSFLHSAYY